MRRLLLVDDDEFFLTVEGDLLRERGYEVIPVSTSPDALAVDWPAIDGVICDLEMPQMNGLELLRAVRESGATTAPFLFLTGRDPPDELVALAVKYDADYLPKDPDATALYAWLDERIPRG